MSVDCTHAPAVPMAHIAAGPHAGPTPLPRGPYSDTQRLRTRWASMRPRRPCHSVAIPFPHVLTAGPTRPRCIGMEYRPCAAQRRVFWWAHSGIINAWPGPLPPSLQGLHPPPPPSAQGAGEWGGGGWDPKICVPKMAQPDFPDRKFRSFPTMVILVWGGGGGGFGGMPPPLWF